MVEKEESYAEQAEFDLKEGKNPEEMLKEAYGLIISTLKEYSDMKKEHYNIIALWVIGTYWHRQFPSYPYLFFNAMKGSGKSRMLGLIAAFSKDGEVINDISESVLFRTGKDKTLCIDELERIRSKEKQVLRELFNSCYKQGIVVKRMKKKMTKEEETYEEETFDLYHPISMANINGIESVLEDRCITLVLEKSFDPIITRKVELFRNEEKTLKAKAILSLLSKESVGSVVYDAKKTIYSNWNHALDLLYTTHTTHTTHTTYTTYIPTPTTLPTLPTLENVSEKEMDFFRKLFNSGITGRNLELTMPLFILAESIGEECLVSTFNVLIDLVKQKKEDDSMESTDVLLFRFLAERPSKPEFFIPVRNLYDEFRDMAEADWMSIEWFGRALKRADVIVEKRRQSKGMDVRIAWDKAVEKSRLLNHAEPEDERIKCPKCDSRVYKDDWVQIKGVCRFCAEDS